MVQQLQALKTTQPFIAQTLPNPFFTMLPIDLQFLFKLCYNRNREKSGDYQRISSKVPNVLTSVGLLPIRSLTRMHPDLLSPYLSPEN